LRQARQRQRAGFKIARESIPSGWTGMSKRTYSIHCQSDDEDKTLIIKQTSVVERIQVSTACNHRLSAD